MCKGLSYAVTNVSFSFPKVLLFVDYLKQCDFSIVSSEDKLLKENDES